MCCGSQANLPVLNPPINLSDEPAGEGQITLRFMLGMSNVNYWGVVTGTKYTVSSAHPLVNVDIRDASTGNSKKPGLLELTKSNRPVFTQA